MTGAFGYIGSHVCLKLLQAGHFPVLLDNLSQPSSIKRMNPIGIEIGWRDYSPYLVDLCDLEASRVVFVEHPDLDAVIHLAAYKSVPESEQEPIKYYQNNLTSTLNLIRLMKEFRVEKIIYSSSCSIYGNVEGMVTEATPKNPQSVYARTKLMCEEMIRISGLNAISLRYFNPIGTERLELIDESPDNLFPSLMRASKEGTKFKIFGTRYPTRDGTAIRDYIHVGDLAQIHCLVLHHEIKGMLCLNVGTGSGTTVREIVNAFSSLYPIDVIETFPRSGDIAQIYADNTLLLTYLTDSFTFRTIDDCLKSLATS